MNDMRSREGGTDAPTGDAGRPGEPIGRDPRTREPIGVTPTDRSAFNFSERGEDESIPELLRRLADQGSHLAQQQTKLVEAEVRASVSDIKEAAGAMAGAGVVGIAGLGVLLMGLSFLLAEAMDLWLATLIVAFATLAGAYALFLGGKKKLRSSSMGVDRTRRTIERAPGAISGTTNEGRTNDR